MTAPDDSTPLVRVGLKRIAVAELVAGDPLLHNSRLLAGLNAAARAPLFEAGRVRRFAHQALLFEQGHGGGQLLMVARGQVRLVARHQKESVELGAVHKGDIIGEGELLGDAAPAFSAVADGEVDAIEFPRASIQKLLKNHPAMRAYLAGLRDARRAALDEMASFLGRW